MQRTVMHATVSISVHLISVPTYKLLILDTYRPDTLHLRQQGCEDPSLFFPSQKGIREQKTFSIN